jgi:hypothetical protein
MQAYESLFRQPFHNSHDSLLPVKVFRDTTSTPLNLTGSVDIFLLPTGVDESGLEINGLLLQKEAGCGFCSRIGFFMHTVCQQRGKCEAEKWKRCRESAQWLRGGNDQIVTVI